MKNVEHNLPEQYHLRVKHLHNNNGHLTATHATIYDGDKVVGFGQAVVGKNEKSPSRRIGRAIAVGRAMKQMKA